MMIVLSQKRVDAEEKVIGLAKEAVEDFAKNIYIMVIKKAHFMRLFNFHKYYFNFPVYN